MFIILAISTLVGSDGVDADKRLDRSKQILTMLVGILGTIIGFYFGTAAGTSSASPTPIKIVDLKADLRSASTGETFKVSGTITGGKSPYTYTIVFDPKLNLPAIVDKQSAGKFVESITVPQDLTQDTDEVFSVVVKDADGKAETIKGGEKLTLKAHKSGSGQGGGGTNTPNTDTSSHGTSTK